MINVTILILKLSIFPFLDGDVPRSTSYGVFIPQSIRFARAHSHVADGNVSRSSASAITLLMGECLHDVPQLRSGGNVPRVGGGGVL